MILHQNALIIGRRHVPLIPKRPIDTLKFFKPLLIFRCIPPQPISLLSHHITRNCSRSSSFSDSRLCTSALELLHARRDISDMSSIISSMLSSST